MGLFLNLHVCEVGKPVCVSEENEIAPMHFYQPHFPANISPIPLLLETSPVVTVPLADTRVNPATS